MKPVLISLDPYTASRLEEVAPAHSHKRSAFIRAAIQKALDAIAEEKMAEAYRRQPQAEDEGWFDPDAWEKETWTDDDVISETTPKRRASPARPAKAAPRKRAGKPIRAKAGGRR